MEGILKRASVDSEGCLWILGEILWAHVGRPYYLRLVKELVHLQDRSLLVWSTRVDWREQPGPALTFKLHDNAADIGRIRHAQKHFALDDIEVGVVLMRMLQHDVDNHLGRLGAPATLSGFCFRVRQQCVVLSKWVLAKLVGVERHVKSRNKKCRVQGRVSALM